MEENTEIERKYLLRGMPALPPGTPVLHVLQGWIPGTRLRERVRRVRSADGIRYYRTIKFGSGIRRTEVEEETSAQIFRVLWRLTRERRIRKRRYLYVYAGRTWEIDRFTDFDLVLAEIELDSESEAVELPPLLAELLDREVTDDPGYTNYSLAAAPPDRPFRGRRR